MYDIYNFEMVVVVVRQVKDCANVQLGFGTIKPTFHLIVLRGKQITLLFLRNGFKLQNIYHFLCFVTADAYVLSHSRISSYFL